MALVVCPECGEETLDQLVSCPLCNEPLVENQKNPKNMHVRLCFFGLAFLGGLVAATLCNIMGYTNTAIGLAVVGLASMLVLIFNLQAGK